MRGLLHVFWGWYQQLRMNTLSSSILPFCVQNLKLGLIPGEKNKVSPLSCVLSKSWILSSVIVIKVKIASHYFHLLLSTENFNFKNSIFLIMPNVMQKDDHNGILAPPHPQCHSGCPPPNQLPKCLSHSGISKELMIWTAKWQDGTYNHTVYYVSDATRSELRC